MWAPVLDRKVLEFPQPLGNFSEPYHENFNDIFERLSLK